VCVQTHSFRSAQNGTYSSSEYQFAFSGKVNNLCALTGPEMRQFTTIASNAFMELVRQPVFLLLMTTSAAFEIFLTTPYYFAFGDEPKLVKDSTLAVMLLSGLLGAVLTASSSLAREIRGGTALAVLSKPIGRAQFLLAKYAGLVAALALLTYINLIPLLLASRMAFDAYGSTDLFGLGVFALAVVLAYSIGGFSNFFLRRPFVSDAVLGLVLMLTVAFVVINFFNQHGQPQPFAKGVDWDLLPAAILVLFAVWILAGVALACSTRFDVIPTLAICSALFLLGLMSDYLFGARAKAGSWWASILYAVTPNWQLFWVADALNQGKSTFQWGYVLKAFGYVVSYVGAALALAVVLFEERELS
jgi:ABC-type transport system involved in multi-copper enzyme maturation permease subunit